VGLFSERTRRVSPTLPPAAMASRSTPLEMGQLRRTSTMMTPVLLDNAVDGSTGAPIRNRSSSRQLGLIFWKFFKVCDGVGVSVSVRAWVRVCARAVSTLACACAHLLALVTPCVCQSASLWLGARVSCIIFVDVCIDHLSHLHCVCERANDVTFAFVCCLLCPL
jgi:hypothetical protein